MLSPPRRRRPVPAPIASSSSPAASRSRSATTTGRTSSTRVRSSRCEAGSVPNKLGGCLLGGVDRRLNTDNGGWSVGGSAADISAHRFRLIVGPMYRSRGEQRARRRSAAPASASTSRTRASRATSVPLTSTARDTDVGLALEFGGGVWFTGSVPSRLAARSRCRSAFHNDTNQDNEHHFEYTSYDIDLLFGVRALSRRTKDAAARRGDRSARRAARRALRSAAGTSAAPRSPSCAPRSSIVSVRELLGVAAMIGFASSM